MKSNRHRDTKPELAVRRLLHRNGFRYRVDYQPLVDLRRRADIVFTRDRLAVFIDGCFWHGCPVHYVAPRQNADFWMAKVFQNKARDANTSESLETAGWTVIRFWEHEPAEDIARRIGAELTVLDSNQARQDTPLGVKRDTMSAESPRIGP